MATNKGLVPFSSCSLCCETYTIPKVLPCGHTFCLQCIQSMVKKSIKGCPNCQKIYQLPSSGKLEDYPTNYDLLNAIGERSRESVSVHQANASEDEEESSGSQMEHTVHCILHDQPYEFFCKSCSEQSCKNCLLSKHNPSKHKITTKEDYLQEQAQDAQKLTKEINRLLSMETDLGKQLAKADSKCQQEAKKLEDQIMEDLEMKIKRLRREAEKMIKDVSAESQRKCGKLKKLREEQRLLMTKTREQGENNDAGKRAIKKKYVIRPNKLKEIQKKVEQLSKQTINLHQSSVGFQSGLLLKIWKQRHQIPYLGYIESTDTSSSIPGSVLSLKKSPRKVLLPALIIIVLLSILLISGAYLLPVECLKTCPHYLLNIIRHHNFYHEIEYRQVEEYCDISWEYFDWE